MATLWKSLRDPQAAAGEAAGATVAEATAAEARPAEDQNAHDTMMIGTAIEEEAQGGDVMMIMMITIMVIIMMMGIMGVGAAEGDADDMARKEICAWEVRYGP
jgi:hypothetical protein